MPEIADLTVRKMALDLSRSFIVQAPAGSGKTELLIQRFLNLLGQVEQPEQIVCMTFTRKAAGEMQSRIFSALERAAEREQPSEPHLQTSWELALKVLEQDRKCGWNLLNNPGRLKIQTIDSFCAWIVHHMPLKSRLGGSLNPEEFSRGTYAEAAKRILEMAEENSETGENIRTLLKHLDNNKLDFLNRIQYLLEKRDQWIIPFFSSMELTSLHRSWFENTLSDLLRDQLKLADALFPASVKATLPPLLALSAENLNQQNPDTLSSLTGLKSFPDPTPDNIPKWRELANRLITSSGTFRKKPNKKDGFPTELKNEKESFKAILEDLSDNRELESVLDDLREIPDSSFSNKDWAILEATFKILKPMENTLREIFRKNEVTDFTEISLAAIDALGDYDQDGNLLPTDLTEYLDYKIQHILVDEYQDTSFKQYELLKRLTAGWQADDGRSLFIVGDPMQSIFRFRDAEVGIFLKSQNEGIGDYPLEKLTLTTNFRSQKNLVAWVNDCFQQVFPKKENPDSGKISYSPSKAFQEELGIPGVQYHCYEEGDFEKEACDVADLIQTLSAEYPGKNIAILARAKRHLQQIIRTLRDRRITYRAEDIDPLSERWEVLDLLSLLRAILKPMDRIAWLSVLRTPWVGLTMTDLHELCVESKGMSVWSLLLDSKRLDKLTDDGKTRAEHFVHTMKPALENLSTAGVRNTLEALWISLGGPACIPGTSQEDIETFFDELESFLDSQDEINLQAFENRLETIFSKAASDESNLQLITMHKAKGLEFDFVILPGLGRKTQPDKNRLVFWLPHKQSLLLAPIEETGTDPSLLYRYIKKINSQKDLSEAARLLYVATTRAKCQLHLFGNVSPTKKEDTTPSSGSPLGLLWPYISKHWQKTEDTSASTAEKDGRPVYPNVLKRMPDLFQLPEIPETLPTGKEILIKEVEEPSFEWAGLRARCLGTVLHRCLQSLAENGFSPNTEEELGMWEPRVNTAFKGMGLTHRDLNWANEQCLNALKATLEDETGRWVLDQHDEPQNEYALTYSNKGTIETRILDRTFVEENIRWIIDYKTGLHEGSDLEAFLKNEIQRHRPQLDGYEKALRNFGETRPIKKAIYHPFYQRLLEV